MMRVNLLYNNDSFFSWYIIIRYIEKCKYHSQSTAQEIESTHVELMSQVPRT